MWKILTIIAVILLVISLVRRSKKPVPKYIPRPETRIVRVPVRVGDNACWFCAADTHHGIHKMVEVSGYQLQVWACETCHNRISRGEHPLYPETKLQKTHSNRTET